MDATRAQAAAIPPRRSSPRPLARILVCVLHYIFIFSVHLESMSSKALNEWCFSRIDSSLCVCVCVCVRVRVCVCVCTCVYVHARAHVRAYACV